MYNVRGEFGFVIIDGKVLTLMIWIVLEGEAYLVVTLNSKGDSLRRALIIDYQF